MDAFLFYFYIFRANGSETRPVPGGFIWLAGGLARGAGGSVALLYRACFACEVRAGERRSVVVLLRCCVTLAPLRMQCAVVSGHR